MGTEADQLHGIALSHLKNTSEQIQCPFCLKCVRTTTSRDSMMDFCRIFGLAGITFRIPTLEATVKASLFIYFVFFRYKITHKCSSCYKKVAVYNTFTKTIRVQAPSFGSDPAALSSLLSLPSVTPNERLGNRSEFIQCPHCHHFAYSKVSGGSDVALLLSLYGLLVWLPFVTYNLLLPIYYYIVPVMVVYLIFGTHLIKHKCPSCFKKIASFNIFTGRTFVTLPPEDGLSQ